MTDDKTIGTKVEGAMDIGGPLSLTFIPHLGVNIDNKNTKSVKGCNFGLDIKDEKSGLHGWLHVKNGNNSCHGDYENNLNT